jgi:hypothetical protein
MSIYHEASNFDQLNVALNRYLDHVGFGDPDMAEFQKLTLVASQNGFSHHAIIQEIDYRINAPAILQAEGRSNKEVDIVNQVVARSKLFQTSTSEYHLETRGLQNLGNTCFMNAALQGVASFEGIDEVLSQPLALEAGEDAASLASRQKLQTDLRVLVQQLKSAAPDRALINQKTREIADCPKIKHIFPRIKTAQEDSFEFLQTISDLLGVNRHRRSAIQVGHYSTITGNPIGGAPTRTNLVPLLQQNFLEGNNISIQQLIEENLGVIEYEEARDEAARSQQIRFAHDNLPDLHQLSFVLPRFGIDQIKSLGQIRALFEDVRVPINGEAINLRPVSVICHQGRTAKSGHYVTIIKEGDHFKEISDSTSRIMTKAEAEEMISRNGYLVNYNRF